jgi:hypothetical protein
MKRREQFAHRSGCDWRQSKNSVSISRYALASGFCAAVLQPWASALRLSNHAVKFDLTPTEAVYMLQERAGDPFRPAGDGGDMIRNRFGRRAG